MCLECHLSVQEDSEPQKGIFGLCSFQLASIRKLDVGVIRCPLASNMDESRFGHVQLYSISVAPFLNHAEFSLKGGDIVLGHPARDLDDSVPLLSAGP